MTPSPAGHPPRPDDGPPARAGGRTAAGPARPRRTARRLAAVLGTGAVVAGLLGAAPAQPDRHPAGPGHPHGKSPVATGYGGAVSSVDADASAAGIRVLRNGGNAADAAVATAAALGVTEPYSAGIGGGGYFVYYDAATRRVHTLDGRETAPRSADRNLFTEDGEALPFDQAVTSGLGVGTPGTAATWEKALRAYGTKSLAQALRARPPNWPGAASRSTGPSATRPRRTRTASATSRRRRSCSCPAVNCPRSARGCGTPTSPAPTGNSPARAPTRSTAAESAATSYRPCASRRWPRARTAPRPGDLTAADLRTYRVLAQRPTRTDYRGLDVYGMAPSSSGGTTVAEALNILERSDLGSLSRKAYLHRYLEAGRIAFADRGRWVGDPAQEDVPTRGLTSQRFADARECLIDDAAALRSPVAPGDPRRPESCERGDADQTAPTAYEGENTTHLTVADKWGNVVAYTLTIEQTGGSGITVPGRGFLLNNELTDFSFVPSAPGVHDPNLPGPGKRPRSSMSPTVVLRHGKPVLALGSPGGSTIITTVLQTLTNHLDRGMPLVDAIAAPRASQRKHGEDRCRARAAGQPGTPPTGRARALVRGDGGDRRRHRGAATARVGPLARGGRARAPRRRFGDGRTPRTALTDRHGPGGGRAAMPPRPPHPPGAGRPAACHRPAPVGGRTPRVRRPVPHRSAAAARFASARCPVSPCVVRTSPSGAPAGP